MSDVEKSDQPGGDAEVTDEGHTDEDSLSTESDSDDLDYESDDQEPTTADVGHLIESDKTWHQLSEEEVWHQMVAQSSTVDTKKKVLNRFGGNMLLDESAEELAEDTALHHADCRELAQLILESVGSSMKEKLILSLDQNNHSPLDVASKMGRVDVVEYFLSLGIDKDKLLLNLHRPRYDGEIGNTALHLAANKRIAELLVNAVSCSKREDFVWAYNDKYYTPLHQACREGKTDVVRYLLSLCTPTNKWDYLLGFCADWYTPLHCAKTSEIGTMLIEFASKDGKDDRYQDFICGKRATTGETALHTASRKGRLDVVLLLVSLEPYGKQLVKTTADDFTISGNNTPLHMARNAGIADIIIKAIDATDRLAYVETVNDSNQTVLHYASQRGRATVIKYFLKPMYEYMFSNEDDEGNTPLLLAVDGAHAATTSIILEYFSRNEKKLIQQLKHTNSQYQNVFHLAGRHCNTDVDEVLTEYKHLLDADELTTLDIVGNSPIHYLLGTQKLKAFADQIMTLPLATRRELFLVIDNQNKLNCQAILDKIQTLEGPISIEEFFMQSVMNTWYDKGLGLTMFYEERRGNIGGIPPYKLKFDLQLLNVKRYALHEYSLTDIASTTLLKSDSSLQTTEGNMWLFIDDARIDGTACPRSYQQGVRKLDTPEQHGMPKVVIRRKIDKVLNIIPPGPDYIIITATYRFKNQETVPSWPDASLPTNDIGAVVETLSHDDNVVHVTVNSTLGKHYISESGRLCMSKPQDTSDYQLVVGENRGQALLLCNKKDRDEWKVQHDDAMFILEEQLGLKVTSAYDLTADQMAEEIIAFSNSSGHGQMAALVILSHGDCDGNISGVDKSLLTVQRLIKEFCSSNVKNIPQVVILSFCRGGIPSVYNRLPDAHEVKHLPEILQSSDFAPSKKPLPAKMRRKEHKVHPFPDIEVPVNCHVYFTTLPDSKSPQEGVVFQTMRKYLHSISHLGVRRSHDNTHEQTTASNDQANQLLPPAEKYQKFTKTRAIVELVTMFTDVAGEVREKSQFKVYTNHCYTVNKDSKPVVIEILDT